MPLSYHKQINHISGEPVSIPFVNSKAYYFVCPSYGHVMGILYFIENLKIADKEITIITISCELNKYWINLIKNKGLQWHVLYLDTSLPWRFRNVAAWFTIGAKVKRLYESTFKLIDNCSIYCFASGLDFVLLSIIKCASKNNFVVFVDIGPRSYPLLYSVKALIIYLHTLLFYHIKEIKVLDVDKNPYVFLSESFFEKHKTPHYCIPYIYNSKLATKYLPELGDILTNKHILWLDDDCWLYEKKKGDAFKVLTEIKRVISKTVNPNIVLYKKHPNPNFHLPDLSTIYQEYIEFPSNIPADFIINGPEIRYVISGFSTVLSIAAAHTNIIAISYIKLIPFRNENHKKHIIEFLTQESMPGRIMFVDSVDDISSFLISSK